MATRVYILDFDGVICDSREECLVTSYNAYQQFRHHQKTHNVFQMVVPPPGQGATFRRFRFLARRAREYKLLWDMIACRQTISPTMPLHEQTLVDQRELEAYHELFYEWRRLWMQQAFDSWLAHNPFYPGVFDKVREWIKDSNMFILSAKDQRAIGTIMAYNGLPVPPERIFSMEGGDKPEQFHEIARRSPGADIVFIDDHLENLVLAKDSGFQLYLATWGYTSDDAVKIATDQGITALSLEQFVVLP